jgi:hypothetical protein
MKESTGVLLSGIFVAVIVALFASIPFTWTFNVFMTKVFSLPEITYVEGLCGMIFVALIKPSGGNS